jgi:hypothetical protein
VAVIGFRSAQAFVAAGTVEDCCLPLGVKDVGLERHRKVKFTPSWPAPAPG